MKTAFGRIAMETESKQMHVREHHSILAAAEKQTLIWLAARMPAGITSDHLTMLGFAGMITAGLAFVASSLDKRALVLVPVALAVNWFGDSLDGTLARVRNCQRPRYGYYTDHVLDLIGTFVLLGGLALSGHMSPIVALVLLAAYMMVTAEVFLSTHVMRVFRLSSMGFGPTELRIVLSIGALYLLRDSRVCIAGSEPFLLFDVGGVIAIAGLTVAMLISASRNIRILYREEPQTRQGAKR